MKLAFELNVPDGALAPGAEAELLRSVKQQAILKLYADDRITTGEVAGALGLTRIQFLDLLPSTGVKFHVELDEEDFAGLRQSAMNMRARPGVECSRLRQQSSELPGAVLGL
ncbi:MAG: UPF0175 family protein [Bryobacteraceae bacterium]